MTVEFLETYSKLVIPSSLRGQFSYGYRDSPEGKTFVIQWSAQNLLDPNNHGNTHQYDRLLWDYAINQTLTHLDRAIALLCLRCCVSWYLRDNIQYIVRKYGKIRPDKVSYSNVAAELLTDVEIDPIVCLHQDTMYCLQKNVPINHRGGDRHYPFSFEILRTWKPNLTQAKNLRAWVKQKSTNNSILKKFGICNSTPWYLLSRAKKWQLKRLSQVSYKKTITFQHIYRQGLLNQRRNKYSRLPPPTSPQLQQIQTALKTQGIQSQQTIDELYQELIDIAEELRDMDKELTPQQRELAQQSVPTEPTLDPAIEHQIYDIIEETFGGFDCVIQKATQSVLTKYAHELVNGRQGAQRLANFQQQGNQLYCQGLSQQDIATTFGISQSTVSRLLNIKTCIKNTHTVCVHLAQTAIMGNPYIDIDLDPDEIISLSNYLASLFKEDLEQAHRETSSASNQGQRWQSSYSLTAQQFFQTTML